MRLAVVFVVLVFPAALAIADEPAGSQAPNRVPVTRPDMKQALEDLKFRTPRIPAPELTSEELEKLGDRRNSLESRLRLRYLPQEMQSGGSRESDPNMSLTYEFKTMMFWIVARTNNCHY
jgi:hypothetical protein